MYKPSRKEEEYFLKLTAKQIKELRKKLDEKRKSEEVEKKEKEFWMKCPKCGGELKEKEFKNVKIDVCSSCEGIWLDKGELEILMGSGGIKGILRGIFSKK